MISIFLFISHAAHVSLILRSLEAKYRWQHLNPSKSVLHEQFCICRTKNTPLSLFLSFGQPTVNTPENPLCSCRWNQEGKQQEMLYIEQITCSIVFLLLLTSLYDTVQPYWNLWHCEQHSVKFDASFTVTRPWGGTYRSTGMRSWEQSFVA